MNVPRILIAGVGNIFFGDDGFGVEVAQRLAERPLSEGVRVVDFGIRGLDLAYALLDGYDAAILVDAVARGGAPGKLYVLELDAAQDALNDKAGLLIEPHTLDPARVLALVKSLGGNVGRMLLVGCQPQPPDPDDLRMELSEPVRAAVQESLDLIESLIEKLQRECSSGVETLCAHPVGEGSEP
ncbi:MAG TPA: hydrogenase maturation protease [Gemmataceae bacterium]|nr:hydrogenase maturation protease [Gemmataceae bacterium]